MDATLRRFILTRDRECLAYKFDKQHVCRDKWGTEHWPSDQERLTIEHVKHDLGMGIKANDDAESMVAMCWAANVGVPSKVLRAFCREYLTNTNRAYPYRAPR